VLSLLLFFAMVPGAQAALGDYFVSTQWLTDNLSKKHTQSSGIPQPHEIAPHHPGCEPEQQLVTMPQGESGGGQPAYSDGGLNQNGQPRMKEQQRKERPKRTDIGDRSACTTPRAHTPVSVHRCSPDHPS